MTHNETVLVRAFAENERADGNQGVEPAAGLVDGFGNEVCRETLFEYFLIFKGIVPLRERHGAGIVPAVDDLGRSVHGAAAFFTLDGHFVDVGTVKLNID